MRLTKLSQKTLLIVAVLFAVIAATTSLLSGWELKRRLTDEYRSKGIAIAKSIADSAVELILNGQAESVQATIDQFLDIPGVSYVLVKNGAGEVISHTFVPEVPAEIRATAHEPKMVRATEIEIAGRGRFLDVSAPVLAGIAGFVHVGMDEGAITAVIWSATTRLQLLLLGIFVASVLAASVLVRGVAEPLTRLAGYAGHLAETGVEGPVVEIDPRLLGQRDEVGALAASFRHMETELRRSAAELKHTTAEKERIESELRIARDIQMSMLPKTFPPFPGRAELDIHALIQPAREVGGDFYDFFLTGDERHLCFAVGDVSGKGVPASLFMAVTTTLLRAAAARSAEPAEILAKVNRELCRDNETCMFVTVFLGVLDLETGEVAYCNGGHNPPYRLSDGGAEKLVNPDGMLLGCVENATFRSNRLALRSGETLFLYTDGVTEAMDPSGRFFSDERLELFVGWLRGATAQNATERSMEEVRRFAAGAPQADDITLLVLRYVRV